MGRRREHRKIDKHKYGMLHFAIEMVIGIIVVLGIAAFVVGISRVDGESMYPTLEDDQIVLFNRLDKTYEQGDIVAIKMPTGQRYVKRVIATEGDVVEIKDGAVYVNGAALNESYAVGATEPENEKIEYPLTVADDCVFVLGDNREVSVDSRSFREVSLDAVKGKLLFVE